MVEGKGPNLMGRDLLEKIKLNWAKIKHVSAVEDILAKYCEVFKKELCTLCGATVSLCVDAQVQPHFFKSCPVPYQLTFILRKEPTKIGRASCRERVSAPV